VSTDVTPPAVTPVVRQEAEALLGKLFALQTDTSVVHVWRGQANVEWEPLPTLYRRLLNRYPREQVTEDLIRQYETDLLCESNGLGFYQGDRLKTMVALQHHGGATRFLDVSRSVLVSLWFATDYLPSGVDGVVYHVGVPSQRVHRYDRMSNFDEIIDERHAGRPIVYFPRPHDERIKAQQAGFLTTVLDRPLSVSLPLVSDSDGLTVEAVRVPQNLKGFLRRYLESSTGLDTVGIYPDFAGYALANSSLAPFPREHSELHDGSEGIFPNRR
jgi:hypothetical protein